jgi:hypothetical protein
MGTGFKARNASDIELDQAMTEWSRIWKISDNLSPEELRNSLENLRSKYPYIDGVLLARKGGLERDRSYAYNVLSRIPPGQKDEIAAMVGLDPRLLFDKFYADKGDLTKWAESDRQRFMAAIVDIGAVVGLPDSATQQAWNAAKTSYETATQQAQQRFGEDIWQRVDAYYAYLSSGDTDKANALMDADPAIGQALGFRDTLMMNNPETQPYYMPLNKVQKYYNNLKYETLRAEFGQDIYDIQQGYFDAKIEGTQKQYLRDHPELPKFWDRGDELSALYAQALARISGYLKAPQYPQIRTPEAPTGAQSDLLQGLQSPEETAFQYTWNDWKAEMPAPLQRLVQDYAIGGQRLPPAAMDEIEYIANGMDLSPDLVLELMSNSINNQ